MDQQVAPNEIYMKQKTTLFTVNNQPYIYLCLYLFSLSIFPPVPEIQLPLLDAHSADGASGPSAHSLYHHGNKMSRVPPCTDNHEEEEVDNNDESATSDSSDTTDFNDVSLVLG